MSVKRPEEKILLRCPVKGCGTPYVTKKRHPAKTCKRCRIEKHKRQIWGPWTR